MKMGDLFLLTPRVIVYIPNPHVRGKAVQVKERERVQEEKLKSGGCAVKLPPQ